MEHVETKNPCKHCPFRKDKPNWMDSIRLELNQVRAANGIIQMCHMAAFTHSCAGARISLDGGSDSVMSVPELYSLEPCKTVSEMVNNYLEG